MNNTIIKKCWNIQHQINTIQHNTINTLSAVMLSYLQELQKHAYTLADVANRVQFGGNHCNYSNMLPILENMQGNIEYRVNGVKLFMESFIQEITDYMKQQLSEFQCNWNNYTTIFNHQSFNEPIKLQVEYDFTVTKSQHAVKVKAHSNQVITCTKSINNIIIASSNDQTISIWDKSLDLLQRLEGKHHSWIRCIDTLQIKNKLYLVSAGDDQFINIYCKKDNQEFIWQNSIINEYQSYIRQISMVGDILICAKGQKTNFDLFAYSFHTGVVLYRIATHNSYLTVMKHINPQQLLTCDNSGVTCLWKICSDKAILMSKATGYKVSCADYYNNHIYCGNETGKIKILTMKFKVLRVIRTSKPKMTQIQVMNQNHCAFSCKPNTMYIMDTQKSQIILILKPLEISEISTFTINQFWNYIVLSDVHGHLFVYDYNKQVYL